jgi:hypothetical protein
MSSKALTSYEADFVAWTAGQAALLRAGRVSDADIEHIAEELEDLGKSQRQALASHIRTVLEHLFKLQASPALEPRAGWRATIRRARDDIDDILADSPSLRREVNGIIGRQTEKARRNVAAELADRGEEASGLAGLTYGEDAVCGPWMPS